MVGPCLTKDTAANHAPTLACWLGLATHYRNDHSLEVNRSLVVGLKKIHIPLFFGTAHRQSAPTLIPVRVCVVLTFSSRTDFQSTNPEHPIRLWQDRILRGTFPNPSNFGFLSAALATTMYFITLVTSFQGKEDVWWEIKGVCHRRRMVNVDTSLPSFFPTGAGHVQ